MAAIVAGRKHSFLISISQEATAERFIQKSARLEVNACLEHLVALNNLGGSSCSNEIAAVPAAEAPPQWEKFVSCACSRKEVLDKKGRYAKYESQVNFCTPYAPFSSCLILLLSPSVSLCLSLSLPLSPSLSLSLPLSPSLSLPSYLPSLRIHHNCRKPTVLLLDDNMALRSMRYEYFQMARKCKSPLPLPPPPPKNNYRPLSDPFSTWLPRNTWTQYLVLCT